MDRQALRLRSFEHGQGFGPHLEMLRTAALRRPDQSGDPRDDRTGCAFQDRALIDPADIQAIRERQLPKQKRYAALSGSGKKLIEKRGQLTDDDRIAFLEAGFEQEHLLEVVAVIAASTITNYSGKITNPPLEALLQEHAWRGWSRLRV